MKFIADNKSQSIDMSSDFSFRAVFSVVCRLVLAGWMSCFTLSESYWILLSSSAILLSNSALSCCLFVTVLCRYFSFMIVC